MINTFAFVSSLPITGEYFKLIRSCFPTASGFSASEIVAIIVSRISTADEIELTCTVATPLSNATSSLAKRAPLSDWNLTAPLKVSSNSPFLSTFFHLIR